jgi:hypothetical protein
MGCATEEIDIWLLEHQFSDLKRAITFGYVTFACADTPSSKLLCVNSIFIQSGRQHTQTEKAMPSMENFGGIVTPVAASFHLEVKLLPLVSQNRDTLISISQLPPKILVVHPTFAFSLLLTKISTSHWPEKAGRNPGLLAMNFHNMVYF